MRTGGEAIEPQYTLLAVITVTMEKALINQLITPAANDTVLFRCLKKLIV
jgi:hypothetical protein